MSIHHQHATPLICNLKKGIGNYLLQHNLPTKRSANVMFGTLVTHTIKANINNCAKRRLKLID